MAFAALGYAKGNSSSGNAVTSASFDSAGAHLLIVAVGQYEPGTNCAITDSVFNTGFVELTNAIDTSNIQLQVFYKLSPSTSSTHTVTATGTGSYMSVGAQAFSAGGAPTYDQEAHAATTGLAVSKATGSITPATSGSLIISACGYYGVVNRPDVDGYVCAAMSTISIGQPYVGNGLGVALGYKLSESSAINPDWSFLVGGAPGYTGRLAVQVAAFAPPATAGSLVTRRNMVTVPASKRRYV